jgi:hypothetical protein
LAAVGLRKRGEQYSITLEVILRFLEFFTRRPKASEFMVQLAATRKELDRAADPTIRAALQRDIDELNVEVAFDELADRDPQGPAIRAARDQLRQVGSLLDGGHETELGAGVVIEVAVHHGAPIYNAGSHIGCALIYDYAARLILRILKHSSNQGLAPVIRNRLGLVSFQPVTALSANKRAWDLRSAFDEILAMSARSSAGSNLPAPGTDASPKTRRMVFISHASLDKAAAEELVRLLEAAEIRCWMAPRDIQTGSNYSGEIVDAIKAADVTLVLLSSEANRSSFIPNEIERAVSYRKPIVTVRLENVMPARELELFIGSRHWIDLFENDPHRETNLRQLVERLRQGNSKG